MSYLSLWRKTKEFHETLLFTCTCVVYALNSFYIRKKLENMLKNAPKDSISISRILNWINTKPNWMCHGLLTKSFIKCCANLFFKLLCWLAKLIWCILCTVFVQFNTFTFILTFFIINAGRLGCLPPKSTSAPGKSCLFKK